MDGSSVSSPLESPEAPITSSVVTLQSAESLSIRRQVRLANEALDTNKPPQIQNQISFDKTPDTPSAKISQSSSDISRAFTTNFALDSGMTSLQIHHLSLDKTPDTPSANISSRSSSELSQAFTSQFAPENSPNTIPEESCSPSALLTPSTEFFPDDPNDQINYITFGDEPFDISQFDYDLSCFNTDCMSQKSDS